MISLWPAASSAQGPLTPLGPPGPTFKTLQQVEPRVAIAALPFTITNRGSYYLTTNLTGMAGTNGIQVRTDDVTLDLGGHTLLGVGGSLAGIVAEVSDFPFPSPVKNLAVYNGTVRGWGSDGIRVTGSNTRFEHLLISDNGAYGLLAGNFAVVQACAAQGNGGIGIGLGANSVVSDCVAYNNTGDGFQASDGVISRCAALANGGRGFTIFNGRNVIVDCQAVNNTAGGIQTGGQSTIRGCTIAANFSHGILAGNGTTIQNCTISQNQSGDGIQAGSQCLIAENSCTLNSSSGVRVTGGENRIEGNNLIQNGAYGLRLDGTNNFVIRNSARRNGTNYLVTGSQTIGPVITATGTITTDNPWANFEF